MTSGDNLSAVSKNDKTLMQKIRVPFEVIKHSSSLFWLWSILVISLANIGIIVTFYTTLDDLGVKKSILLNVEQGNFFTASIAMMAWGFYDFAKDYLKQNSHFRKYKASTFLLAFILTIFLAIFTTDGGLPLNQPIELYLTNIPWTDMIFQLICYIVSAILSIYIYCISWMEDDRFKKHFAEYDDYTYSDEGDKRVEEIKKEISIGNVIDGGVEI